MSDQSTQDIWLFTDGACSGNPGPGGWAFLGYLGKSDSICERGGYHPRTTNNQMELEAVCQSLMWARDHHGGSESIVVFTDSTYVIQGITQWIHNWKRNNWQKADKSPVLNREYWERLHEITEGFGKSLSFRHVRGHAANAGNNRVDEIAVAFSTLGEISLYDGPASGSPVDVFESAAAATSGGGGSKKKSSTPKGPGAYYLSYVDGVLSRHQSWADCERVVKGRRGAKFKKLAGSTEEAGLLAEWGVKK